MIIKGTDEGRRYLWSKTKGALTYIYENKLHEKFHWILKADDDTFVIMENLRFFLTNYSPTEPLYFGQIMQELFQNGYMTGGAGKEILHSKTVNVSHSCIP